VKKEINKSALTDWLKENGSTEFATLACGSGKAVLAHIERASDTFYVKPEMPGAGE
jgi:hypothetical protein